MRDNNLESYHSLLQILNKVIIIGEKLYAIEYKMSDNVSQSFQTRKLLEYQEAISEAKSHVDVLNER